MKENIKICIANKLNAIITFTRDYQIITLKIKSIAQLNVNSSSVLSRNNKPKNLQQRKIITRKVT